MDSKLNARAAGTATLACVLSAGLFYLSTGLNPPWWSSWLAPLPVLWICTRLHWRSAAGVALLASALGRLSMWHYNRQSISLPLSVSLESVLVPALLFAIAVLLYRAFAIRRQTWLAVLSFPLTLVACGYLLSLSTGTFGNTAYTQMDNVALLQISSLTGIWGIAFVVLMFAPLSLAIVSEQPGARKYLIITFVVIFGGTYAYGAWRILSTPAAESTVLVGLAETDTPANFFPQTDDDAMRLMRAYAQQVQSLAGRGAKIVVLPEMTAVVRDTISPRIDELFQTTARSTGTRILLGVLRVTEHGKFNEARLFSATSQPVLIYRKRHLVPGLEAGTTPVRDSKIVAMPAGKIGLEICRDMDYTDPADGYARANVGLVLAPAWDQGVDRWWHGHMALMRGIENGFSIVRNAKNGFLTVSDDRGRVLAETATSPERAFTTLLARVPVHHDSTLYPLWGDWFAWLDLVCAIGLVFVQLIHRARQSAWRSRGTGYTPTSPAA
jgi:apolipoprotein N-acyltransferase